MASHQARTRKRRASFESLASYRDSGSDFEPDSEVFSQRSPVRSRARASTNASSVLVETPRFPVREDSELDSSLKRSLAEAEDKEKYKMTFASDWLGLAYQWWPTKGVSRTAIYSAYSQACAKYGITPINSACFGKAIRTLFPGVGNRRIGGRKLSRYHYMGIWPATVGELATLERFDVIEKSSGSPQPSFTASQSSGSVADMSSPVLEKENVVEEDAEHELEEPAQGPTDGPPVFAPASSRLPGFPDVPELFARDELARSVWNAFEQHSIALLDISQAFRFDLFGVFIRQFYEHQAAGQLTRRVLEHPAFIDGCLRGTSLVYSSILVWLAKQLHTPVSAQGLEALDEVATTLPQVVATVLQQFHPALSSGLSTLATQFSHLLGRQCAILRMAPSIKTLLSDGSQCQRIEQGWSKINLPRVAEHCAASSNLPLNQVDNVLASFSRLLKQLPTSKDVLGLFVIWLDYVHSAVAGCVEIGSKTAFVINLLMRDLTLRGDAALPAYQLLSCFTQEYLGLKVLNAALPTGPKPSTDFLAAAKPVVASQPMTRVLSAPFLPSRAIITATPSPVISSHTPADSPLLSHHSFDGSVMLPSSSTSLMEQQQIETLAPPTFPGFSAYINLSPTHTTFEDALKSPVGFGHSGESASFDRLAHETFVPHDSADYDVGFDV